MINYLNETPTKHPKVIQMIEEWAELCKPDGVYWCNGTQNEYDTLSDKVVESGVAIRLNKKNVQIAYFFVLSLLMLLVLKVAHILPVKMKKMLDLQTTGLILQNLKLQ